MVKKGTLARDGITIGGMNVFPTEGLGGAFLGLWVCVCGCVWVGVSVDVSVCE